MEENWVVIAKRADFKRLGERFQIDPVIARVIRNRDVEGEEAMEAYLHGDLSMLSDLHRMKDLDLAAGILLEKIRDGKRIRIIGDYDIDGIMATYVLQEALEGCGAVVDVDIPDRIADGYGLNERLIRKAASDGVDTVLTCDNGIAAGSEIALGKELGLTVLVTDHHEVPYEETDGVRRYLPPPADAVVDPRQPDCGYPFKRLCGAAVAYRLVEALYESLGRGREEARIFLQYVAFATVGDVMDLIGENRILVKEGLKLLRKTDNQGLLALMRQNGLEPQDIRAYHIGFILGPCLNASGRLDTALRALRLLRSQDPQEVLSLAKDLTDLNAGRKEMTARGVEQAMGLAQEAMAAGDIVLVLFLPECHESLAGIVAGRVRESVHRPVFILTRGEGSVKGSGRSIEGYSMFEELCKVKDLFLRFGGHPMAAGVSLEEGHIEEMRRRLNENVVLGEDALVPKVRIDVPMPIDYVTPELIGQLELLEPFGKGNEKPLFADRDLLLLSARILGKNRNVCRMRVQSGPGKVMDAVYFGDAEAFRGYVAERYSEDVAEALFSGKGYDESVRMSFAYYPKIDDFQGMKKIQIVVQNYR